MVVSVIRTEKEQRGRVHMLHELEVVGGEGGAEEPREGTDEAVAE